MSDSDEDMPKLQGTLAIIKPDAMARRIEIEEIIMKEGFVLVDKKRLRFTRELAEEFYQEHKNKPFFKDLIDYMTSGDAMAMCLGREDGIKHWRQLIGPTMVSEAKKSAPKSIRAMFGDPSNDTRNAVHGSDSYESAGREIDLIFPQITGDADGINFSESIKKSVDHVGDEQKAYLQRYVVPTLQQGLTVMYRTKPDQPLLWLADWLRKNNPQTGKGNLS
eukprot:TRINITY_DN18842_c0_g1_i1.p1 TRINITY_DN18842_c0_g1~~TRINITY_DN18842_c0_g1_i1.p1  ORF type:complete len:220 (+),score=63.19 TRINITY_DN18842_c0_g1_i1:28-687(+)